jgi:hypothetical protein
MPGTETAKLWDQRLRRFDQADMTVAKFCASEGVSQPSFYNWKRKLRGPATTTKPKPPARATAFLPVTLPPPLGSTRPADSAHAVTTIELPGGIRIRVETPVDQADTTPKLQAVNLEVNQ